MEFTISGLKNGNAFKKIKEKFVLKYFSEIKLYTNIFKVRVEYNDKTKETELAYNDFIYEDGEVAEDKLD